MFLIVLTSVEGLGFRFILNVSTSSAYHCYITVRTIIFYKGFPLIVSWVDPVIFPHVIFQFKSALGILDTDIRFTIDASFFAESIHFTFL